MGCRLGSYIYFDKVKHWYVNTIIDNKNVLFHLLDNVMAESERDPKNTFKKREKSCGGRNSNLF